MTHAVRTRWAAALLAGALTVTLSACSGDPDEPAPTSPVVTSEPATTEPTGEATADPTDEETEPSTEPSEPATTTPATATATVTEDEPEAPAGGTTGPQPAGPPTEGAGADALAAIMPEGFPLPDDLTITGDPTATAENWNVGFTVPSPVEAFDFFLRELPAAGYELRPGTSEAYSPEVSSGAILAQSEAHDVNLLIVDDQVEITITTR
ncbi:MAG: hypothetical protein GX344_11085 [Intrasporangiaceae bacterium]|nr:hypothetical protein [Intrasporangiaceae bacterium]